MTVPWMCPECWKFLQLEVDPEQGTERLARIVALQVRVHFKGHGREAA